MKQFSPGRGWFFPLDDGPWKGHSLRLGWTTRPGTDELAQLPSSLPAPGGRYEKRPWYTKSGTPKIAKGHKGAPVAGVMYVWCPDDGAGSSAASGVLLEQHS